MNIKPAFTTIVALGLAACGNSSDSPAGKPPEISTSDSGTTRTVSSSDGAVQATGTRGGSEARFPDYAPAYPGAKVQSSVNMDMAGKKFHNINMISSDKPEVILAFYLDKAQAAGQPAKRAGSMLSIGKAGPGGMGENSVSATETPSGTSISIMAAQP